MFKRAQKGGAVRADAVAGGHRQRLPAAVGDPRAEREAHAGAAQALPHAAARRPAPAQEGAAAPRPAAARAGPREALNRTVSPFRDEPIAARPSVWTLDAPHSACVIGPLFVGHGTQKLFGWFGGHGLEGTAGFFEGKLGLQARQAPRHGGRRVRGDRRRAAHARRAHPVAAGLITGTMITAIRKVHAPKGPWVTQGGYEYNAVLIAAMLALTADGPGTPVGRRQPPSRG